MSKCCPHCKGKDFHLQTPAVFHFNGDDFVGDELLCDITENLNSKDFDDSYLACNKCEWDGKVKDLIDVEVASPKDLRFFLLIQGYARATPYSFEPASGGEKATCGIVVACLASKEAAAHLGINSKIDDPDQDLYIMRSANALPKGTFLAALPGAERIPED